MLARRLTLLTVFVGGCLSGATLIVVWRSDGVTPPGGERAAISPSPSVEEPAAEPHAEAPLERVTTTTDPAHAEPPAAPDPAAATWGDVAGATAPPDAGSSVADVLAQLEAAYRQKVAAPVAPPEPARVAEAPPAPAPAPLPAAPTPLPAALVAAAPVAPPTPVTHADALPALAPRAETRPATSDTANAPVAVSSNEARPSITVGDIHTTTVNNVHQGDVILMQQLALLQNIQLLALSPYGRSTGLAVPAHAPRGTTRRAPPFATSLTNPDNPWGFDFPPTVLAK